jgi:hypothetical protein
VHIRIDFQILKFKELNNFICHCIPSGCITRARNIQSFIFAPCQPCASTPKIVNLIIRGWKPLPPGKNRIIVLKCQYSAIGVVATLIRLGGTPETSIF